MGQPPQQSSLKRRDSFASREEDKLIITPLGAGNEVGRSCVYMNYKGKTVLVRPTHNHSLVCFTTFGFLSYFVVSGFRYSLIAEFIPLTRAWLLCPTLMRLILPRLMSFSSLSTFSVSQLSISVHRDTKISNYQCDCSEEYFGSLM